MKHVWPFVSSAHASTATATASLYFLSEDSESLAKKSTGGSNWQVDDMASLQFRSVDDKARCLEVQALFKHTRELRDRYTLLRMRSLALRGRATTTDEVMKFLILRANHLVAKVYAFLPAQLGVK